MPKQGFWFLRAVREGRPRVRQRHQGLATSVCGDPGGAIRRSLRARKRGRARAPFASFARRSAIPRTQQAPTMRHKPAIIGAVLFTQEKAPPKRGQLGQQGWRNTTLPPSISSRNMSGRWPQRKSPAETGAKWVMLLANWRGPPRRSNNAGREPCSPVSVAPGPSIVGATESLRAIRR
jgi:hypothetical protein